MTADQEKQLQAMFAAGDPAARLPKLLPHRVAARLQARPARPAWQLAAARAVVLAVALASSAGLGAVAVWAAHQARKETAPEAARPAAVAAAVAAQAENPLAVEAQLVRSSLEALARGDAALALARLDERERRFPEGALWAEGAVARARALLLAGRTAEALEGFERLPASELSLELRLTWADVLAAQGLCPRALEVLQGVVAEGEEARVAAAVRARCGR